MAGLQHPSQHVGAYLEIGDLPAAASDLAAGSMAYVLEDGGRVAVVKRDGDEPVGQVGRHGDLSVGVGGVDGNPLHRSTLVRCGRHRGVVTHDAGWRAYLQAGRRELLYFQLGAIEHSRLLVAETPRSVAHGGTWFLNASCAGEEPRVVVMHQRTGAGVKAAPQRQATGEIHCRSPDCSFHFPYDLNLVCRCRLGRPPSPTTTLLVVTS